MIVFLTKIGVFLGSMAQNTDILLQKIADELVQKNYSVIDGFFSLEAYHKFQQFFNENLSQFRPAAIGHKSGKQVHAELRSDSIFWIDEHEPALVSYFQMMIKLKDKLKEEFFFPLRRLETQAACYTVGSFYQKHRDRHFNSNQRWITVVFYLNEHWTTVDGGELMIYQNVGQHNNSVKIEPQPNRMVIFLSELEHEVLMTHQVRKSFTTWFREDL